MLIFQANDKVPLSDESMAQWDAYLTKKCNDDEAILLPNFIDFCCLVNDNMLFQPTPMDDMFTFDETMLDNGEENDETENTDT